MPEHLNELFLREYTINDKQNLRIDEIADRLLDFLKKKYYSQPSELIIKESWVVLTGFDEEDPKVYLEFVNSPSKKSGESKDGIDKNPEMKYGIRFGKRWRDVEAMSKNISERFDTIKINIARKATISKPDSIFYTLNLMKEAIKLEAREYDEVEMRIGFPIHYCLIEINKPIDIKTLAK